MDGIGFYDYNKEYYVKDLDNLRHRSTEEHPHFSKEKTLFCDEDLDDLGLEETPQKAVPCELFCDEELDDFDSGKEETPQKAPSVDRVAFQRKYLQVKRRIDLDDDDGLEGAVVRRPKKEKDLEISPGEKAVKKLERVFRQNHPTESIPVKDQKAIRRHIAKVSETFESPKRAARAVKVLTSFAEQLAVQIPLTTDGESLVATVLKTADDWSRNLVFGMIDAHQRCSPKTQREIPSPFPPVFHNWTHIEEGDESGGRHIFSTDLFLEVLGINKETGVIIGEFFHRGTKKISSFFPEEISSVNELKRVLEKGSVVAKEGNKELLQAPHNGQIIHIERCYKNGCVSTCYPIFFYSSLDKEEFIIGGNSYPRKFFEEKIQEFKDQYCLSEINIIYRFSDRVIFDFSELFPFPGVYIEVSGEGLSIADGF